MPFDSARVLHVIAPRQPAEDLLRFAHRPLGFLLHMVRSRWLAHAVVLLSVLAAVGCSVGSQYAVKTLIDTLAPGPEAATGVWWAMGLLAFVIAADNLLWRVGGWVATGAFTGVARDVRSVLFRHLSGHLPSYFADRSPGVLASRVSAAANGSWTILSTFTWNALPPTVAVTFAIALLAGVDAWMALTLIAIAGGLALLLTRLAAKGKPLHQDYAREAASVDGEMVDVVSNIGLVRAFGATFREQRRFDGLAGREAASRRASLRYLEKLRLLHAVVTAALTAGLLVWALLLWQAGRASTGDIVMIVALGFTILHGTRDLAVALVDITQHLARLSEGLESLLVPHELPDAPGAQPLRQGGGAVAFRGVRFSYGEGAPVLRGLDLEIRAGERVGLVGQSGAGKSTVLALLQRFAAPQSGDVLLDGQDINEVTQRSLAETIAVVPQDTSLLQRSILENIRYGRPDATDAEVIAAAEAANCREFIEKLPEGFATQAGGRGVKLSGGQRQRIAIARALLRDAPILLLDEATSALDSESEALVQGALDRLMRGRTVIAVAHRLATLRNFDRIVVMREGRVIDDGAPAALAARPGPFRELLQKQSGPAHAVPAAEERIAEAA
ncbi:ABC transporter ATP-binding protein/permease [Roseomonas sp. NAR14]|uniref:ABC transporter ATP-binding protein/permease n=1 Tax=Roseomonas acroporae TaxID=2937791 RepID=A0A9X2BSE3_9PROT|nr:ABC transporter ATP-binding protein [Roseomonas acroporae]MCK8783478.1 ABC transporter ATP-binding protein/permease [Roseomonas acroporae]